MHANDIFVGKEFAPRSLYYGIWKSRIISRERANSFTCCKSRYRVCLDSLRFIHFRIYLTYPTDKGKGASYELERGINWNTFKSITATAVHTFRHGLIPPSRGATMKLKRRI